MHNVPHYLRLSDHALLRHLEIPYLYDRRDDDLYELNQEGFDALARCDGTVTVEQAGLEPDFLEACTDAKLLETHPEPFPRIVSTPRSSAPHSLRYLEVQVTRRCNLRCKHCYLGSAQPIDMSPSDFEHLCHQFDAMGGLRFLVSGGEPLVHPQWEELNAVLAAVPVRRVLLSNGQSIDKETAASLSVDAVQLSIDGLKKGHEAVRGSGTFDKVLQAATNVLNSGLDLSIATMAHAMNLEEFEQMATFVHGLGATEWSIDAPCVAGRLEEHLSLQITPQQAAKAMRYGFGGAYHGGNKDMACGLHLATVGADGLIAQCGFYFDNPLGTVGEGLESVWARREALTLDAVEGCRSCKAAEVCGGGCRYRAESLTVPDTVMCELHGIV